MSGFGDLPWGEGPWGDGEDEAAALVPVVPAARGNPNQLEIDELGVDIDILDDLPPTFRLARGPKNLFNALLRRLSTPPGALALGFPGGDPDYGFDVRGRLNGDSTPDEIASLEARIEEEVRKDERVEAAEVAVSYTLATSTLEVDIRVTTAAGPYRLILVVSGVTVELLRVE